jgi:muramoyltetrapeptide carboxypeptidase
MIPPKLKSGDYIRVIAPAHSFSSDFTDENRKQGIDRVEQLGLTVSFGKYVDESDDFKSTTVQKRLEDLHDAFADPQVKAIIPTAGGSSANQLLKYIDYDLIKANPKILCGLSDITDLANAIHAKTGLVVYYGPHFTMLSKSKLVGSMLKNMHDTFFESDPLTLNPPDVYADDEDDPRSIVNEGYWAINSGKAEGRSIGGNLLTMGLSFGSGFVAPIKDTILFIEENDIIDYRGVQKQIQAILNQPGGDRLRGMIIGRFQKGTAMTRDLLTKIIKSKPELASIPVVGNVDVSHTVPMYSFPIGGRISMEVLSSDDIRITILKH